MAGEVSKDISSRILLPRKLVEAHDAGLLHFHDMDYFAQRMHMLMTPGSSLGGARPKASVVDPNGNLWIAKFPSKNDVYDVEAWKMVVHMLAENAGLNVAESRAQTFASKRHTFLTKRFDRASDGRIHFVSAMTLLGYSDGTDASAGASYLELAEFVIKNCINLDADLRELWARIVFSICVKNTDDHLRNHGFLLQKRGWALLPPTTLLRIQKERASH